MRLGRASAVVPVLAMAVLAGACSETQPVTGPESYSLHAYDKVGFVSTFSATPTISVGSNQLVAVVIDGAGFDVARLADNRATIGITTNAGTRTVRLNQGSLIAGLAHHGESFRLELNGILAGVRKPGDASTDSVSGGPIGPRPPAPLRLVDALGSSDDSMDALLLFTADELLHAKLLNGATSYTVTVKLADGTQYAGSAGITVISRETVVTH